MPRVRGVRIGGTYVPFRMASSIRRRFRRRRNNVRRIIAAETVRSSMRVTRMSTLEEAIAWGDPWLTEERVYCINVQQRQEDQ